jgi:hypothetical protein
VNTGHSLLGASGAHRWLACPGSFGLSQSAPHRPSSSWAATGTLAHELIEDSLKRREYRVDESRLGVSAVKDGYIIDIDRELIDGVNLMLGYIEGAGYDQLKFEFPVDLADYFKAPPPVKIFGTVDAAGHLLKDEVLEIIDYKNGAGVSVTPVENPQLMFYAAGVLQQMTEAQRALVKTVLLTIVQPNAPGPPIKSWAIDLVDLLMWVDDVLIPGVEACVDPDAPFNTGTHCRFCPVSHACPKLLADAMTMARQEFDDVVGSTTAGNTAVVGTELAEALDIAERAQLWISRLQEFALDQLQRQVKIPGWELVPTRPTRKWLAPDSDIAKTLQDAGAGHDEVWEIRVRSPAQMEKSLHKTQKGRAIWDRTAQPLIELRSTGTKLGRIKKPDADKEFDDDIA